MSESKYILGISALYHDSAAALLENGRIVAAAQEERFTRIKHDAAMPTNAIQYCLNEAGIGVDELDYVAFYEKPLLKFDRLMETWLAYAPRGFKQFLGALPSWLNEKLRLPAQLDQALGHKPRNKYIFLEHHESHAASAFFPSPFEEAVIVTLDGVGEWASASIGIGRGNQIELLKELQFPHSLGLLYSAFTYFAGFKVNSGEYKLMGLAPYGRPSYRDVIMQELLDLKEDGSFRLNMRYFNYCYENQMCGKNMEELLGLQRRRPESPLTQEYMDLAASIQCVTEEIMLRIVRHAKQLSGLRHLCLAGGVALNCVGNGKILRQAGFEKLWIQPAAGDAGGALGAALFTHYQLLQNKREPLAQSDAQAGSQLGPEFNKRDIGKFLDRRQAVYEHIESEAELSDRVAELLDTGNVIGWFQGRMEFGPRALGNRSILGDARNPEMQSCMNLKIKFRESFRPFAPSVLHEDQEQYFALAAESPYMLMVAEIQEGQKLAPGADIKDKQGLELLKTQRSLIPGVTHVDYSARVQSVDKQRNPRFHQLLQSFKQRTGCSLLINTSFNIRGEPIVCTPEDAYRCFLATNMDALVLNDFLLLREKQPKLPKHELNSYLDSFELD
ncbi:MAG: carbamoyltransferase [Lentisphaeria bacterium]|nr:carbamoyltransferase [Lentisphaeria bacterium]